MSKILKLFFFAVGVFAPLGARGEKPKIVVGSKTFTEGYILSEIVAQIIEGAGEATVERRLGLGATGIIYESLASGQIDIYPEYTGTVAESILKKSELKSIAEINAALSPLSLIISESIGFNDSYALAVRQEFAVQENINSISDLKQHPEIRAGFTHEFLKRSDGFDSMTRHYQLDLKNYTGMEHSLAYESLAEGKIDLIEVYSTDAKIKKYGLKILNDNKDFFPNYFAVLLMKKDFAKKFPRSAAALQQIAGAINEDKMIELNAKVELEKWSFEQAAKFFLDKSVLASEPKSSWVSADFLRRTKEHLALVFFSLLAAVIVSLPMGLFAARSPHFAQAILAVTGVLQTIPSLALLCFLIPMFGIGYKPAVIALFLYALLPIVRNTYLGFTSIDSRLLESAQILGLSPWDRLRLIELPLASPAILAGIKLSAVLNVGMATLAAFIGAGGYGAIIATGLALNDTQLILQGAIPSAVLALSVHSLFEFVDRRLIPKGLNI